MKKVAAFLSAIVLAALMTVPASAAGFTPSVEQKESPSISTVTDASGNSVSAIIRDADGNVTRGDMILGLNRLSSLMWIFMIKLKAGRYERK